MSEYPLEPQLAKVLLSASDFRCVNEILTIVSLLNVPMVFLRPKECTKEADMAKTKFYNDDGDHLTLMNAYNMFKVKGMSADWCYSNFINYRAMKSANDIRSQLANLLTK